MWLELFNTSLNNIKVNSIAKLNIIMHNRMKPFKITVKQGLVLGKKYFRTLF